MRWRQLGCLTAETHAFVAQQYGLRSMVPAVPRAYAEFAA
jgi:hypothetical protein